MADRFGARRDIVVSQIALIAAFVGLSRLTPSLGLFYVGYAALAILGAGTTAMTWSRAITGRFVAGRGLALGLSLIGSGLVGAVLPSLCGIPRREWRHPAGVSWPGGQFRWFFGLPVTLQFFQEPEDVPGSGIALQEDKVSQDFRLRAALSTRSFWQMSTALMVLATAISALIVHAIPLLSDRGVSPAGAAALAELIGVAVTIGRLVSGFLLDHLPGPLLAFGMFSAPALVGLAGGAEHDMAAYFCASYVGHRHYGKIYGSAMTGRWCSVGGCSPFPCSL